ncbi:MAG: VOC family protein [Chloroflexi bacterium]|nr:VOC family protein [Chloroflexota bacterium]MCH8909182.1 VOC family protein [Chloroflexota bacterium]
MGEVSLGPIGQIAMHVSDIDRSIAFYGGKLGMTKIFAAPNLAFFDNGGVRLMLNSGEGEPSGERSVIYYRVDDIQSAYEQLASVGVELNSEPHVVHSSENYELWMAFFKDPDGNQLAVMDERGELS